MLRGVLLIELTLNLGKDRIKFSFISNYSIAKIESILNRIRKKKHCFILYSHLLQCWKIKDVSEAKDD